EKINEVLAPHIFPPNEDGTDPRLCPNCGTGRLSMRTARSGGAFIGCSNYPECRYTRPFGPPGGDEDNSIPPEGKMLGMDEGDKIWIHKGRFGPYVQRGDVTEENKKPKRQSVPKDWPEEGFALEDITLEHALKLLSLPRLIGTHPEDGVNVWSNIGRYGPYLKHADSTSERGGTNANLPTMEDVFTVGMNHAVELLAAKVASRGGRGAAAKTLKVLGEHPDEGGPIAIMEGKYGPYVKWEKVNATLPKGTEPDALTIEQAVQLIEEKAAKKGTRRKAAPKKKAATKKKTAAKKS
ncbi:MAG: topoisomerase C-terminal repeat-containing protein, partial [Pseudomonadota bacterium]